MHKSMSEATENNNNEVPLPQDGAGSATSLSAIAALVDEQVNMWRTISKNLKKAEKEIAREHKRLRSVPKTKRTVVQKPIKVNNQMHEFLKSQKVVQEGAPDGEYTRQVMMKAVSAYIKEAKLQLKENMKKWKPDATLTKLFGLKKGEEYTFMNINGLISRVVNK